MPVKDKGKKIDGELFVIDDGNGYVRLCFKSKKGKIYILGNYCGGGYYSDVFFEEKNDI